MTKVNPTTQDNDALKARPAEVQPPQHQHTTNITISGVGESEDAEFREPTPSQASSASPKSTDTRPVASRAVSTNGGAKKTPPFTDGTEFLAVGLSEKRGKFLLVAKDDKHVVLSVRNLARDPNAELDRLEALDVHLLVPHARQAFLRRAQEAAKMEPTFKVATQIGWFDDVFVLPDRVYPPQPPMKGMPQGWSRILVHLDAKDEDIHSRFRCHGSPQKSQEIFRLCRGHSRLMFAAAFSFVGPCCKPFGLRAPGVQSVGKEDSGKTVLGIVAGATYGGVPDSSLGFGSAWNGTPNGLEEYGPAHSDTLMVLDETSLMPTDQKGRPLAFGEALMRLMQGQGKKRHGLPVDRWSDPTFSTSNRSVYALLDPVRRKSYGAYTDRLMDIPTPNHAESHFEELHGHENAAAFGKYLFDIATTNYGYPIRVFLARFTSALARDREGLAATVASNVATYEAAASKITSSQRSVLRVRGHFATVYAVGCLAIQLQILPFTEDELLAAILSCHRDHVAFVDNEVVGGPPWSVGAAAVQEVVDPGSVRKPIASAVVPGPTPFDRLQRFINRHRKGGFIHVRAPGLSRLRFQAMKRRALKSKHARVLGYVAGDEYLIPGAVFDEVAGGSSDGQTLKKQLLHRGLIETCRRGAAGVSYVVKRPLPDGSRPFFVVIRHKAKKP